MKTEDFVKVDREEGGEIDAWSVFKFRNFGDYLLRGASRKLWIHGETRTFILERMRQDLCVGP